MSDLLCQLRRNLDLEREKVALLERENAALRFLAQQLDVRASAADQYEADLNEIGKALGCNHIEDGLARCVRDTVEDRDRLRGALREFADRAADMGHLGLAAEVRARAAP